MSDPADRLIGRALSIVVGVGTALGTFFLLLLATVAVTTPDAGGSRAPGWLLNVLLALLAAGAGILAGRGLWRRFTA